MPGLHYRIDLDKTYLATPYEQRRALLKIALEPAEEKQTLPGMMSLTRALKEHPHPSYSPITLTIISASPRFLGRVLRRKLKLDRIAYDYFILKDHWKLLKDGRVRELLNPILFKLTALLSCAQTSAPSDHEVLIGDDWDLDPFVYTFYSALRTHTLPLWVWERTLLELEVPLFLLDELERFRQGLPPQSVPPFVLIRRERRRGEAFYANFGSGLTPYDDTLQLALILFDLGYLEPQGVREVIAELKGCRWRLSTFAFSWEGLKKGVYLNQHHRIEELLKEEGVLTLLPFSGRVQRRRPKPLPPNWEAIFSSSPLAPPRGGG